MVHVKIASVYYENYRKLVQIVAKCCLFKATAAELVLGRQQARNRPHFLYVDKADNDLCPSQMNFMQ